MTRLENWCWGVFLLAVLASWAWVIALALGLVPYLPNDSTGNLLTIAGSFLTVGTSSAIVVSSLLGLWHLVKWLFNIQDRPTNRPRIPRPPYATAKAREYLRGVESRQAARRADAEARELLRHSESKSRNLR